MSGQYILAIDQGTSGTKAVLFDRQGQIAAKAICPIHSFFPQPGFVEQDPEELYQSVLAAAGNCLRAFREKGKKGPEVAACGISNQRETFLLWDPSGCPLTRAIVWQCKRSVDVCTRLKGTDLAEEVQNRTGLLMDPYFSGTKLIWLCENEKRIRDAVKAGRAYFGTIDTWLLYKLTGGKPYCTDYTNASRTLFFNIDELKWDEYLLDRFSLTGLNLPEVRPSSHDFGKSDFEGLFGEPIQIASMIGDSHAAAFGEGCFTAGTAKATLGTGCSILLNTGPTRVVSKQGMVTTICWSTGNRIDYALEGVIVTCGATIQWLRDHLGLFAESRQTEAMALAAKDNHGVCLIPAFSGMGTPYWRMDLKAAILGLTFGCDKTHIVRAALESMAFQVKDVLAAMEADSGIAPAALNVDGGITANRFVMQFLADLLNLKVMTLGMEEVSALGAACLAGLEAGLFKHLTDLEKLHQTRHSFSPGADRVKAGCAYEQYCTYLQMLLKGGL
jgi:glycerol kinase